VRFRLRFTFWLWMSNDSSTTCWKHYLSSIKLLLHFVKNHQDIFASLFLFFVPDPLICLFLYQLIQCLNSYRCIVRLIIRQNDSFSSFLFSVKLCFLIDICRPFMFNVFINFLELSLTFLFSVYSTFYFLYLATLWVPWTLFIITFLLFFRLLQCYVFMCYFSGCYKFLVIYV
jgi:hypothetical protein